MTDARRRQALLVDFGGVLDHEHLDQLRRFCESEGLDRSRRSSSSASDPEAWRLLRALEKGEVTDASSSAASASSSASSHRRLIDRLFAGLRPSEAMIEAVERGPRGGHQTGLISNSWGTGIYDRAPMRDLRRHRDLRRRRPAQARARDLPARRRADRRPAGDCVFVDDLRENVAGAEAVGMTALLHRDPEETIAELERLLGLELPV